MQQSLCSLAAIEWSLDPAAIVTAISVLLGVLAVHYRLGKSEEKQQEQSSDLVGVIKAQLSQANGIPFAAIEGHPFPAWIKLYNSENLEFRMMSINAEYFRMTGIHPREYEGKTDFVIWPQRVADAFYRHDIKVVRSGMPMHFFETFPTTINKPDGATTTHYVIKFPVRVGPQIVAVGGWMFPIEKILDFGGVPEDTIAAIIETLSKTSAP